MIINNIEIENKAIYSNLKKLTNQIYKLLPNREEGLDWQSPLKTIIEEFCGMSRLMVSKQDILFSLLCKLEGLFTYVEDENFYEYRRTIFECLNMVQALKDSIKEDEE